LILSAAAWVFALGLLAWAATLGWRSFAARDGVQQPVTGSNDPARLEAQTALGGSAIEGLNLPELQPTAEAQAIARRSSLHTTFPNRPGTKVRDYTVDTGDSVFEIAAHFNIEPESVLWANYEALNDNPDMISVGMELKIPPADGVLYQWQEGDTLEKVAGQFEAKTDAILSWPGNNLDLIEPKIEPGAAIFIPGGRREFRQWIIPTIARGNAGVSSSVYGGGACSGAYEGAYGSGTFIWPAGNHVLSGNDYWSGHLAIDIGAGDGAPIYAADAGVVVFAGWATGGYGNMVMIDHGNGYQTLYAHMSSVAAGCGRSVGQGTVVGYAGSTGNSTGAHLHFEVRYMGGFVSPWYVLPAP